MFKYYLKKHKYTCNIFYKNFQALKHKFKVIFAFLLGHYNFSLSDGCLVMTVTFLKVVVPHTWSAVQR